MLSHAAAFTALNKIRNDKMFRQQYITTLDESSYLEVFRLFHHCSRYYLNIY